MVLQQETMAVKVLLRAITILLVLAVGAFGVLFYRLESERGADADIASGEASDAAIGKFNPLAAPLPAPEASFTAQSGETVTLAAFRGKVVLVNLWATWCAPCIQEMPSLARLQAKLGDLAVVAVSEDRRGADVVDPFLAKIALAGLAIYLDPKNDLGHGFRVDGLPTSYLIDRDGRIVAMLEGAADWDSAAMVKRLGAYLGAPPASPS
jgi:thiol-disulfide isomerase/thioredoxin